MAKTATKTASNTRATASGQIVPMRGKNEPDLVSERIIISAARDAITAYDAGEGMLGSATQRMAFAVMAQHQRHAHDGATIPALRAVAFSREATSKIMEYVREPFIGKRPSGDNDHERADAERLYTKHAALLNRAVELASVLAQCNVGLDQFNTKIGNWSVPAARLFPPSVKPLGELATKMVFLDGRGYGGIGKNKKGDDTFAKVQASVMQLVNVAKPAKPKQSASNSTGAGQGKTDALDIDWKPIPADRIATGVPFEKLLAAFKILFVTEAPANAKLSDQSPSVQNALADIVKQYDAMRHRDEEAKSGATKSVA